MRACILFVSLTIAAASLPAAAQTNTQTHPRHSKAKPAAKSSGPPAVPAAAPPVAVIPPPDLAPPHPTAPPPPPPVHDDAPGDTTKITNGLRLTFGASRADFNPAAEAALQILAHAGQTNPGIIYNLYAHAAGTAEDVSTPRRLSLQRALAVRSALINAGIASTRIYVHAMGSNGTDTGDPADRVDLTLANFDATPTSATTATP